MSPEEKFQKILIENNLGVKLLQPKIRTIINGGFIVEQPQLSIFFIDPEKEKEVNGQSTTSTT